MQTDPIREPGERLGTIESAIHGMLIDPRRSAAVVGP